MVVTKLNSEDHVTIPPTMRLILLCTFYSLYKGTEL